MKTLLFSMTISVILSSCHRAPTRVQNNGNREGALPGSDGRVDKDSGDTTADGTLPSIEYSPSPGSAMRLLDGNALSVVYARIFPARSYGFEICKGDEIKKFRSFGDCSSSIFAVEERPFVGVTSLNTPDLNRGTQNIRLPEDLTLNYMRTVRAALHRECQSRVDVEYQNLVEGKMEGNFLIKAQKPTKQSVDEFFRTLLGVAGSGMAVSYGAESYLAAFEKVTDGKSDPASFKLAYNGLCIAVAMDPQILIY